MFAFYLFPCYWDINRKDIMKNLDMTMEDFLVKVSEMYQYNLEQYPEENPTMQGAFEEVLEQIYRKDK